MRKHWWEPGYWLWVWREAVPLAAKFAVVLLLLVGLLGAGWAAADGLTSTGTQSNLDAEILVTTVQKLVTVREKGKVVPVVRRVAVTRTETVHDTQVLYQTRYQIRTVTSPGEVRTVRRLVTRSVPVVTTKAVTVNGETQVVTVVVPTTTTQAVGTVTRWQTITKTQTSPSRTARRTETERITVTQTETKTKTRTEKETKTVVQTVTKTVTRTDTVTVTKPEKKNKGHSGSSGE